MVAAKQRKSCKQWQMGVLKNLQSLPSTSPPDCCIIVGTERIPVHKAALQLNSSLLTSGDVAYKKQSQLIEIELLPEFSEYFHLVSEIVNSFYTGNLDVVGENMKTVYKFAKCYCLQWIMDYVRPMFVEYIKKDEGCERVVEIFKFAQSIWCTDLSDTCCELLDSELFRKILEGNVISQFDFFSIKSIASSDKLRIPEKDIFDLVVDWLKTNSSRCHNFGNILESIQYHMIESDYLSDVVFDFVLDQPNLPDISRKVILRKVKDSMRQVPERNTRCTLTEITSSSGTSRSVVASFSPDNDECLRKIALWMSGKRYEDQKTISISNEELKSVISDKFKFMVNDDREMFINFLCCINKTALFFVQFLPLYEVYPSSRLLWLVLEHCTEKASNYQKLYDIPWHLNITFQTLSAMVTNSTISEHLLEFDCKHQYKKRRCFQSGNYSVYYERFDGCGQVELIMLWALANPLEQDRIKQLIDTVCFRKIPQVYKEQILLPSVKTIFPDITELTCAHEHQDTATVPQLNVMRVEIVPGKMYLLEGFTTEFGGANLFYNLEFKPENVSQCMQLSSHSNKIDHKNYNLDFSKNHSFIIFDASKPHLPKYPLFVRNSNLSTIKNIIKCSNNLCFMFYKRAEE